MPPDQPESLANEIRPGSGASPSPQSLAAAKPDRQWRSFGPATLLLALAFAIPLCDLIRFAASSELYSYILLIPFISGYLVWSKRHHWPPASLPVRGLAAGFLATGTVVILAYWLVLRSRLSLLEDDYLVLMMTAFLLCFYGICSRFWGRETLRANAFPLGFLIFMVPLPAVAVRGIDTFLQSGSAAVAQGFFTLAGTPVLQDGLVFQLPNITLRIAPECSGIHSSLVLFIVSLLAGYFFLRTPWKRAVFILMVIPLGILRNGFRVFTIGELCVHIGPHMIDSPIHHKGGPIFFVLSLIPLFLLLIFLHRSERKLRVVKPPAGENPQLT